MNIQDLGALAEVVGAIAVVISLVYVGIQIRKNTYESRISRAQYLMDANSDLNALVAGSVDLSRVARIGIQDFQALNEDEQFQFSMLFFSVMNKYDFAYHQVLDGELEKKYWQKMSFELPLYVSLPGMNEWWQRDKTRFSPEFIDHVERGVAGSQPTNNIPLYSVGEKGNEA